MQIHTRHARAHARAHTHAPGFSLLSVSLRQGLCSPFSPQTLRSVLLLSTSNEVVALASLARAQGEEEAGQAALHVQIRKARNVGLVKNWSSVYVSGCACACVWVCARVHVC